MLRELAGSDVSPGVERVGFSTAVSTYGPSLATALKPLASVTHRRHCAVARAVFKWAAEHASDVPLTTRVGWYDAVAVNIDYLSATWTDVPYVADKAVEQSSHFELLFGSFLDEEVTEQTDENGAKFEVSTACPSFPSPTQWSCLGSPGSRATGVDFHVREPRVARLAASRAKESVPVGTQLVLDRARRVLQLDGCM
jgi:hypothetical protein